ncbi:hypothetical protein MUBE_07090 [Mycobacterium uberis]|uniref:Uncharacterized protein n=1 Tax=Mycobacterium uberis TaxID=2162698 RepID=A0A3E1HHL7_9MYCO|nr:hypothetical protein [Mycobacterium uberis]RFD25953.1 hypothetical protein MUBE_07090 [Mycobacterium uberis]
MESFSCFWFCPAAQAVPDVERHVGDYVAKELYDDEGIEYDGCLAVNTLMIGVVVNGLWEKQVVKPVAVIAP